MDPNYFNDVFQQLLMGAGGGMPPQAMSFAPQGGGPMQPQDIPIPRPRPMQPQMAVAGPAAPPVPPMAAPPMMGGPSPASFGAPPAGNIAPPEENAGILGRALGLDPSQARSLRGSLMGGLNAVSENWKKPGLAAFAGGMGGAMKGAEVADRHTEDRADTSIKQKMELIDRAIKARVAGDNDEYNRALIDLRNRELEEVKKAKAATDAWYKSGRLDNEGRRLDQTGEYNTGRLRQGDERLGIDRDYKTGRLEVENRNADSRRMDAETRQKDSSRLNSGRPDAKTVLERERILDNYRKEETARLIPPGTRPADIPALQKGVEDSVAAKKQALDAELERVRPRQPDATAPRGTKQIDRSNEISMRGNGTQQAPYEPTSAEEYNDMPSGTFYMKDGNIYRKK